MKEYKRANRGLRGDKQVSPLKGATQLTIQKGSKSNFKKNTLNKEIPPDPTSHSQI